MTAIAFALAASVRTETERAEADSEGLRAYYLARGSIDRALLWLQWGPQYRRADGAPMFYEPPMPRLSFTFPSGTAVVELIPENSKINVNRADPDVLYRLLLILGAGEDRARIITAGILDWRQASSTPGQSPFDAFYGSQASSFFAPHASIRELEELLLIRGMTTDLFYGTYRRDGDGHASWHAGLRDCVTTIGADQGGFDINSVEPAVLAAMGVPAPAVSGIVAARNQHPILALNEVSAWLPPEASGRLRIGGGTAITLRATAHLYKAGGRQPSDLKRSVAALIKMGRTRRDPPYTILRWYDNAQSNIF
jgi:general secretion pathway protein K